MANCPIFGLTGGIGAGKSTISKVFAQLGIHIVDADKVARDVVMPNTQGLNAIIAHFGRDILLDNGELNRAKLRDIIFNDNEQKTWLNTLLHPLIRTHLLAQLNEATSVYAILEAPLLFENKLDAYCQKTILVDVPVAVQIQRTTARDTVSEEQVKAIINAQMSREQKQARADFIIDNNQPISHVQQSVKHLHQQLLALCNT